MDRIYMQDCIFLLYYAWDMFCSTQGVARIVLFFSAATGVEVQMQKILYWDIWAIMKYGFEPKMMAQQRFLNQSGWGIIWHHLSIHSSKEVETMNYLQTYRAITRIRRIVITYLIYPNMSICPFSLHNKVQIVDKVTVCITWYWLILLFMFPATI